MSNIYLKVAIEKTDVLKVRFTNFKKFATRSVFGELQLTQILLKNINFNKSKTESKMENPTHSFREKSLLLELI